MSVRQQHRINALNRETFDRARVPAKLSEALQNQIDPLRRRIDRLETAQRDALELVATLQRDKERLISERGEQSARGDFWHRFAKSARDEAQLFCKRWRYVSRLLRLLPAQRVQELHTELKESEQ